MSNHPHFHCYTLYNSLTESDIQSAPYVIYAHLRGNDMYIGYSRDLQRQWLQQYNNALDPWYRHYDQPFETAIRTYQDQFSHAILAVAEHGEQAKRKCTTAIEFYHPSLNGPHSPVKPLGRFAKLTGQTPNTINLAASPTPSYEKLNRRTSKLFQAHIIWHNNEKRVQVSGAQYFPAGLLVECNERDLRAFKVGDTVALKGYFSLSNGQPFVQATDSIIIRVCPNSQNNVA